MSVLNAHREPIGRMVLMNAHHVDAMPMAQTVIVILQLVNVLATLNILVGHVHPVPQVIAKQVQCAKLFHIAEMVALEDAVQVDHIVNVLQVIKMLVVVVSAKGQQHAWASNHPPLQKPATQFSDCNFFLQCSILSHCVFSVLKNFSINCFLSPVLFKFYITNHFVKMSSPLHYYEKETLHLGPSKNAALSYGVI